MWLALRCAEVLFTCRLGEGDGLHIRRSTSKLGNQHYSCLLTYRPTSTINYTASLFFSIHLIYYFCKASKYICKPPSQHLTNTQNTHHVSQERRFPFLRGFRCDQRVSSIFRSRSQGCHQASKCCIRLHVEEQSRRDGKLAHRSQEQGRSWKGTWREANSNPLPRRRRIRQVGSWKGKRTEIVHVRKVEGQGGCHESDPVGECLEAGTNREGEAVERWNCTTPLSAHNLRYHKYLVRFFLLLMFLTCSI